MPTVGEFFDRADIKTKVVAARLANPRRPTDNPVLYYHLIDTKGPIPPSVQLVEGMEAAKIQPKGTVMVNYALCDWINANSKLEYPYADSRDVAIAEAKAVTVDMTRWNQFSLVKLGTKPTGVGIYGAQVTHASSRARRIYMLAAFCLLKKAGTLKGWKSNGHNIASLLVGNDGEVFSWGVNDGAFRHAEVNTIIGYFLRYPTKASLPAKSVLFTTLKPCKMCSRYIKGSWGTGEIQIWFGMDDTGKSGGTKLLGGKSGTFNGEDVEFDLWKDNDDETTAGTKPVQVLGGDKKVELTTELNKEEARRTMAAADWVDSSEEVAKLFEAAATKFLKKVNKADRKDGPMKEVLAYLDPWLK